MKEYLKDIFPRIIRHSKKLDDLTILTEKKWMVIDEESQIKQVWIFCQNKDLIISKNGIGQEGTWRYAADSIYIKVGEFQRLINQAFIDDVVLLLCLDGGKEFIALANEQKVDASFKIQRYLNDNYQEIQIEPTAPYLLSQPRQAIQPAPPTLEELINDEKQNIKQLKSIILAFGILSAIVLVLLIIVSKKETSYEIFLPVIMMLFTLVIIFPLLRKSKKYLSFLINKRMQEVSNSNTKSENNVN